MTHFPAYQTQSQENKPAVDSSKPPWRGQDRYLHGYRWCGKCGEWKHGSIAWKANRCPYCHYMLRRDGLLRAQRKPELVVYY